MFQQKNKGDIKAIYTKIMSISIYKWLRWGKTALTDVQSACTEND